MKAHTMNSEELKNHETLITEIEKKISIEIKKPSWNHELGSALYTEFSAVCNDDLSKIKGRIIEMLLFLSRTAADCGIAQGKLHDFNAEIFQEIYALNSEKALKKQIEMIFSKLNQMIVAVRKNSNTWSVYTVSQYIQKHFREKITIQDIAETVHLNPSYISHLFSDTFGYTITDYITFIRIEHAKTLLQQEDISITGAAAASGYNDVSYFSRVFKKSEGISPKEYKQNFHWAFQ